ncbi:unnamed protein product, partial [marine sediment metagenome]
MSKPSMSSLSIFKFTPIPITNFFILFLNISDSHRIPATFKLSIKTSFGHFIFASKFNDSLIVSATARPLKRVIIDIINGLIFGFKIIENQRPPYGDNHVLLPLPLPEVCVSAKIIV